jgi:hypothetical protein
VRTRLSIVIAIGLLAAVTGGLAAPAQSATYNVKNYGAKADGRTNDQAAFTKAIAAAAKAGGGVVYVPKGTYALRSVYLQSHVDVQIEGGTVFRVASGAINNESVFYLARQGVYSQQAAAASFVEDVSVEGVNGSFTVDLRAAPTTRNHAFTVINVKGFAIANMNAMQNNTNRSGRAPTSYSAVLTFQSDRASKLTGTLYHPVNGTISNIHVSQAPYGFGATQVTSGSGLTFKNVTSDGGVALRFETDAQYPSRVSAVNASTIGCTNGRAALVLSPHSQKNGDVHVTGITANSCEQGVRIAGDLRSSSGGSFTGATVSGVTVRGGSTAQVRDPSATDPSLGGWMVGHSAKCVNVDSRAHYTVKVTNVACTGV